MTSIHAGQLRWFLLLLVVAIAPSAARAAEVVTEESITYGKGGDVELKLDLARPEGDGPFPAIVFIHGGGWRGGNRSHFKPACLDAAKRGYAAVTVTYRLTDPDSRGKAAHPFPAQVNDVKCAVRFLRANADKYKIDPQRIGACGASAGGHLSLLLGLAEESSVLEGDGGHPEQSSRVQAVVNYYGPTDLEEMYRTSEGALGLVISLLGGTPKEAAENYHLASPAQQVSKDDCPVLTLHGTADELVPPAQAKLLDEKMKAAGVPHTLVLLEGQGHGFNGQAFGRAVDETYKFFDKHLKQQ